MPHQGRPVRGPAGPAGSGKTVHNLYVLVVDGGAKSPSDEKSRELTLAILRYVHDRVPVFNQMGVQVRVHRVKKRDLANPRLVEALKRRGITSLPALVSPNNTYVGNRGIGEVYEKNIADYHRHMGRGEAPSGTSGGGDGGDDDALASFYRNELAVATSEGEGGGLGGEEALGDSGAEGGDMMDTYRSMMQRRDSPAAPGRGQEAPAGESRRRAPSTARRGDNISAPSAPSAPYEDAAPAGDSLDDIDGKAGGAADDIMEEAYWANQELSM